MRRWWLSFAVLLLLAACHSKKEEQPEDVVVNVQDEAEPPKGLPASPADSIVAVQPSTELQMKSDCAEVANLRLFARKQRTIYSPSLMVGEWLRATEHEQYMADGSGRRWDTGDSVRRDEAQSFRWTLDSNLLSLEYSMTLGAKVMRQYVVTFVDDETLVYRDAYGGSFMWDKVTSDSSVRSGASQQPSK